MPLSPGTKLGPYEITAPIGAGGMGEVYRAKDTRLDRIVAIKVLPSHLSSNPDLRHRFEREARAVSSLNHPHICTLHDIGHQDGVDFMVMEYIEGESLTSRLQKGSFSTAELLQYSIQIADALDKAHRHGIIHRDLKPGNIMLTKSGIKLLDFGLAKLHSEAIISSDVSSLPTEQSELTKEGIIVGTIQYMAPEQLEGKTTDARTDIFALGAVIYEMATGKKAFEGNSKTSLIAAILKEEPRPISQIQPLTPPALDRLVRICLAKDPEDRWQSAHDITSELKWIAESTSLVAAVTMPAAALRRPKFRWLSAAVLTLLAAGLFAAASYFRQPTPLPVLRANIALPPNSVLATGYTSLALSPDGRMLVLTAFDPQGVLQLWLRDLDKLDVKPIHDTKDATYPFWSPDSRYVGFFADRKLKKVVVSGGPVQTICDAPDGRGASWSQKGTIVFNQDPYGGLYRVSSAGGTVSPVTKTEKEWTGHRLPHFLPDGRRLLFLSYESPTLRRKEANIYCLDLDTKELTLVMKAESEAFYAKPGYLIFAREGNLMAQEFDLKRLQTRGEAVPIAQGIQFNPNRFTGAYSVSDTGLLVFTTEGAAPEAQLSWFDMEGNRLGTVGKPARFSMVVLAPDGQRAVVSYGDPRVSTVWVSTDLWLYDLVRGVSTRFTFQKDAYGSSVIWSPDSRQIAFTNEARRVFSKTSDAASAARPLIAKDVEGEWYPGGWFPDGTKIGVSTQVSKTGFDIGILSLNDSRVYPFLSTPAEELFEQSSPDGKWVMYLSYEEGEHELYVAPYPGPGGRWQISSGGVLPELSHWTQDGRQILYVTPDRKLVAVTVTAKGSSLEIGAQRPLFGGRTVPAGPLQFANDGKRLLIAVPVEEETINTVTLVQNWSAELKK